MTRQYLEPRPSGRPSGAARGLLVLVPLVLVMCSVSGCLTRTANPELPYVKPAQSVPQINPVPVQMASRIQDMEIEMQRLREMIERLQASGGNEQAVRNLQERVTLIERQLGIETAAQGVSGPGVAQGSQDPRTRGQIAALPTQEPRQPSAGPGDPSGPMDIRSTPVPPDEKLYREAYAAYKSGNFDQATVMFDEFFKRFPQSPLAPDALYWTGESRFGQGRYDEAVLLYDRVLKEFPGSKKELNALLKQGLAFEKMGDPGSAKIIFQKIVSDHPHTAQARLASNKMKALPAN